MIHRLRTTCLLLIAFLTTGSVLAENWPCFRGPTRQGISTEQELPRHWDAEQGIKWKVEIPGTGWSSPIVWEDYVVLTTATDGGASFHILALERNSGRVLWDRQVLSQTVARKEERNSYASSTPATDGELVVAACADGSLVAVDFQGQIRWTNRDFPFYSRHGLATSPVLWEDLLITARDGSSNQGDEKIGWQIPWDKSFVMALDKHTGQLRWKTARGMSRIAHVVPGIWQTPDGSTQVVSGAGDVLQGIDARTGRLLWTSINTGEGVVPSIVLGEQLAFTACGWSGRESIKAFRLGGAGDLGETNLAWEQPKAMPRIASYLYLAPYLYTISEGGILLCLQADSGKIVYQSRLRGAYSASPVAARDQIYFLSDEGETTVVQAGPEFQVVARNALNEKTQASMAVSHGQLFIRSETHLWCIE